MANKAIKISEENYKWLVQLSGEMQKQQGKPVSIDKAITMMKREKISDLAGSWEMSDKEAETIYKKLSEGWKKWKISA